MEPRLEAEEGWTPVEPFRPRITAGRFVSGDRGERRFRVAYFRRDADGALVGKAWFGQGAEGPPRHAHGGSLAALLDESMSASAWMRGHAVIVARLEVDFRTPLPVPAEVTFETGVVSVEGRKVWTAGRVHGPGGALVAEGKGLFVELTAAQGETFRPDA